MSDITNKMCLILKEILFLSIFDSNINATSVNTMINMDYNHQRSQSEVSLYFEHRPKAQSPKLCNNKTTTTTITILITFEVQFQQLPLQTNWLLPRRHAVQPREIILQARCSGFASISCMEVQRSTHRL